MTIGKALATVIGTAIFFGLAGMGIGFMIGNVAPEFFRHLFAQGREDFNPEEFGIGIGLVNGLTWGLVVSLVLVAILSWRETRLARAARGD